MKHKNNGAQWLLFIMVYSLLLGVAYSKALGATNRHTERTASRAQYQQNRQDRINYNRGLQVQRRVNRQSRQNQLEAQHKASREAMR